MNLPALAAVAALPLALALALDFEALHGHYAYSLPVAGSTVDIHQVYYMTAVEDDYNYLVHFVPSRGIYVRHYPMSESAPPGMFAVKNITAVDSGTIEVNFADNDYTITRSDTGQTYKPMPAFSHTETIRVNQTFVALCNNVPDPWLPEGHADNSTGLVILQYRGLESHEVTDVEQFLPVTGRDVPDGAGLYVHGSLRYATSWIALDPPREILTHKFLFMSAYTHGRMQCDYPQVIEHTIDSKRIGPADIKAVSGALYERYRQRPARPPDGRLPAGNGGRAACIPRAAGSGRPFRPA